jgi:hypothetical protein
MVPIFVQNHRSQVLLALVNTVLHKIIGAKCFQAPVSSVLHKIKGTKCCKLQLQTKERLVEILGCELRAMLNLVITYA